MGPVKHASWFLSRMTFCWLALHDCAGMLTLCAAALDLPHGCCGCFTCLLPCRKSFVETRSLGTVLVAFFRVYMLHAILLCWMMLLVSHMTPRCALYAALRCALVCLADMRACSYCCTFLQGLMRVSPLLQALAAMDRLCSRVQAVPGVPPAVAHLVAECLCSSTHLQASCSALLSSAQTQTAVLKRLSIKPCIHAAISA